MVAKRNLWISQRLVYSICIPRLLPLDLTSSYRQNDLLEWAY
jgi:hypothetical protein